MSDLVSRAAYAATVQRRLVLEVLRRFGPLPLERLPHVEEMPAQRLIALARELEAEGEIASGWDPVVPGRRLLRITPAGTRRLEWSAGGALSAAEQTADPTGRLGATVVLQEALG